MSRLISDPQVCVCACMRVCVRACTLKCQTLCSAEHIIRHRASLTPTVHRAQRWGRVSTLLWITPPPTHTHTHTCESGTLGGTLYCQPSMSYLMSTLHQYVCVCSCRDRAVLSSSWVSREQSSISHTSLDL